MIGSRFVAPALIILALITTARPAAAAWPHTSSNGNVAICTTGGNQQFPRIIPDGVGGTIVTWSDARNDAGDIYVQRISAAGVVQWMANGVALSTAAGTQASPTIVPDGAGGAIITWADARSGASFDIYAQRISAAGVVQWTADGVALCTAVNAQSAPTIASDGAGGAIVTWNDSRGTTQDIYAQRITAAGAIQWSANGVALCTALNTQGTPTIAPDGAGGAIVAWHDNRGTSYDIYAQRISVAGVVQWAVNGVALCTVANLSELNPAIVSDGAGGAVVIWEDSRVTAKDIYGQRISAAGAVQWTANGVAICNAAGDQSAHAIVSDGAAGAIVTWNDFRSGTSYDIYTQRISAAGAVQLAANGLALCTATGNQQFPTIASDGANGAIVTWQDLRNGATSDIYAQRIIANGAVWWTPNGLALCTEGNTQSYPTIASDGANGAIITWQDFRNGVTTPIDIYAQKVEAFGRLGDPAPRITAVNDFPADQGGKVRLGWEASYLDTLPTLEVASYGIWREVSTGAALAAIKGGGALVSRGGTSDEVRPGVFRLIRNEAQTTYWEGVGAVLARGMANYTFVATTFQDSSAAGNTLTTFMVDARGAFMPGLWTSVAGTGYSVDNLPPVSPSPFTGEYAAGTASLHWNPNTEPDLEGYRLYRGSSVGFVPGPGNLLSVQPDTGYVDAAGAPYVYKLTAVDSHDNESPIATLVPANQGGVVDASPPVPTFAAPNPNPARGSVTLRYTLSRPGPVRLTIYDASGRRVQVLRDGERPAGSHDETFTLRDDSGQPLASGLYLLQLEAEGRLLTHKLATIH